MRSWQVEVNFIGLEEGYKSEVWLQPTGGRDVLIGRFVELIDAVDAARQFFNGRGFDYTITSPAWDSEPGRLRRHLFHMHPRPRSLVAGDEDLWRGER